LPTLEIFRRALSGPDGLLAGKALKTLVNTCTVGGPFIRKVETECAATDVTVIDAPISGGVTGAEAGTLAVMVSGNLAKVAEESGQSCRSDAGVRAVGQDDRRCR
jgi:3-hydroxyisobutyrate dehydrogenase-like beta-hydroxyacid dehydrogenase